MQTAPARTAAVTARKKIPSMAWRKRTSAVSAGTTVKSSCWNQGLIDGEEKEERFLAAGDDNHQVIRPQQASGFKFAEFYRGRDLFSPSMAGSGASYAAPGVGAALPVARDSSSRKKTSFKLAERRPR